MSVWCSNGGNDEVEGALLMEEIVETTCLLRDQGTYNP